MMAKILFVLCLLLPSFADAAGDLNALADVLIHDYWRANGFQRCAVAVFPFNANSLSQLKT